MAPSDISFLKVTKLFSKPEIIKALNNYLGSEDCPTENEANLIITLSKFFSVGLSNYYSQTGQCKLEDYLYSINCRINSDNIVIFNFYQDIIESAANILQEPVEQ